MRIGRLNPIEGNGYGYGNMGLWDLANAFGIRRFFY